MAGDVCVSVDLVDTDECNFSTCDSAWLDLEVAPSVEHGGAALNPSIRLSGVGPPPNGIMAFNRQRRDRDRRLVVQSGLDHYLLQLLTPDSSQGDLGDTHLHAAVGDICIFDLGQMFKRRINAGSNMSIAMPRQALEHAVASKGLHGTVLKAHGPMTPLIASVLRGLCSLEIPLSDIQAMAAQEAVITLLSVALKGHVQGDVASVSPLEVGLRQRIVEFITRDVHLLELSPDFLCRRFNVSRAHMYRAFANDGGVAKVLRDIRLDAAYRELTGAARTSRSITEIAYSLGFSSGNQLLRGFRARFGVTPKEVRAAAVDLPWQGMDVLVLSSKATST